MAACDGSVGGTMTHAGGPHAAPAVPAGASWNEQFVGLLQTVLALKPDLHQVGLGSICGLQQQGNNYRHYGGRAA